MNGVTSSRCLKNEIDSKNSEMFKMPSDINESKSHKYKSALNVETAADDYDEIKYNDKIKVECICPKCGIKHKMNLHWIGRGIPRKFCPTCKGIG
jgi:hypothetical protein